MKVQETQEILEMKIEVLEVQDKKVVLDLIEKIVNLEFKTKRSHDLYGFFIFLLKDVFHTPFLIFH